MAHEFKITRRVEFSETDMAGIMHYSNFFRFMETAEHAFYRSLGFSVTMPETDPRLGWPRVHASCDYKKPARFEDEIEVHLLVREKRSKAIIYDFRFRKVGSDEEMARGSLTVVCVAHKSDGTMSAHTIPPEVADRLEAAPASLL